MENEILNFSDRDEEISTEIKTRERRVYSDKSDRSIYELVRQYQRGNLELQPEFQRLSVWDSTKESRLIESVFLEVPIPIIYLSEESDGKFSVIDGQQRLNTFFKFNKNELKLSKLVIFTELNGKWFRDIPKEFQEKFESSTLRIIEIRKESDPDVKFEIFERLNTGAVPLNSQELRNCIYKGIYNELLKDLSEDKDFQFLLGLDGPHYRMRRILKDTLPCIACEDPDTHTTDPGFRFRFQRFDEVPKRFSGLPQDVLQIGTALSHHLCVQSRNLIAEEQNPRLIMRNITNVIMEMISEFVGDISPDRDNSASTTK